MSDTASNYWHNWIVVLVEPQGALNVGAVCRAMANFGVERLRVVNPQVPLDTAEARRMAVKAGHLLEQASSHLSLAEALADCRLAVATTRRFGRYREDVLEPPELARQALPQLAYGPVALVFGREDRGLMTAELDLCQLLLTMPTADALPSLNLAQAVVVCLYSLYQARRWQVPKQRRRARHSEVESLYQHLQHSLQQIGFLDPQNPEHIMHTLRRMGGRAVLNDRDVRILRGLCSKMDWLYEQTQQQKPQSSGAREELWKATSSSSDH